MITVCSAAESLRRLIEWPALERQMRQWVATTHRDMSVVDCLLTPPPADQDFECDVCLDGHDDSHTTVVVRLDDGPVRFRVRRSACLN